MGALAMKTMKAIKAMKASYNGVSNGIHKLSLFIFQVDSSQCTHTKLTWLCAPTSYNWAIVCKSYVYCLDMYKAMKKAGEETEESDSSSDEEPEKEVKKKPARQIAFEDVSSTESEDDRMTREKSTARWFHLHEHELSKDRIG